MKTIIRTTIQILFIIFPIISFSQQKKNSAQTYIDTKLKTDTLFTNSITAICAVDKNGKTIAKWNSNYNLIPASTLKTITTGMALSYLGSDYKYETKIGITGKIKDSTLIGDLYIIGGGDPTLGSKDSIATPIDTVFNIWKEAICKLGIKSISGSIIVDDSWFEREQMPDSWTWDDFGTYYGCAASGLSFCENIQYHTLIPGASVGDTASIVNVYPTIPDFEIVNEVITSKINSKNTSYYYTQDLALIGKYIGNIPINAKYKIVKNSNKFPHLSCGYHFMEFLNNNGVSICNKIVDYKMLKVKDSLEKPRIIITTYSPELIKIAEVTNKKSNNFYAETLLKTIGKEITGIGCYDSSLIAIGKLLKEKGLNTKSIVLKDGSGLSRQNLFSPKFLCDFYLMMIENGIFAEYLHTFPHPGENGTLKYVLRKAPQALKRKISAKSGSLSGVKCYAGYVNRGDKYGIISFCIMVNNYTVKTAVIQPKIEEFMLELVKCY